MNTTCTTSKPRPLLTRYRATVHTAAPETLDGLQPGQWISYEGTTGRFMGRTASTVWIAWSGTARKRFPAFAAAFRRSV